MLFCQEAKDRVRKKGEGRGKENEGEREGRVEVMAGHTNRGNKENNVRLWVCVCVSGLCVLHLVPCCSGALWEMFQ